MTPDKYVVDPASGCWVWGKAKTRNGYGLAGRKNGSALAHVVSWEEHHGSRVPDGLELDHICRNPSCVNPAHLEAVTHMVNMQRSVRAILTPGQVREIRALADSLGPVAIARRYGVTRGAIWRILRRKTWPNIT